jgi:hypothetical protein
MLNESTLIVERKIKKSEPPLNTKQAFSQEDAFFSARCRIMQASVGSRTSPPCFDKLNTSLLRVFDLLFLVLFLVFVHTQRVVLDLVFQHFVHHSGDRVRRGYGRLGGSQPHAALHPTLEIESGCTMGFVRARAHYR